MGKPLTFDLGNNVTYTTPPIPDEKLILYSDLPKKDQYWRTTADKKNQLYMPPDKDIKRWPPREQSEFIDLWRKRWDEGMWFMNNGIPTYINGIMVDHLVFNKFNGRHLSYIKSQRDDFYFRELVLKNDDWQGMMWVKPRRYGMTEQEITTGIRVLITGMFHHVAIQSDTQEKANTTILSRLIDTYIGRPKFMREDFYKSNGKTPIKNLKLKSVVTKDDDTDDWLGGIVSSYPTNEKALDGKEFMYCIMDEMSKISAGISPMQMLTINLKTVKNFGRIGKVSCLSTTGDSDNVIESVKDWVKLAGSSVLLNGQTKTNSGLVKRFVSAIYSLWLDADFLPDKYGEVDVEKNTNEVLRLHNLHSKGTKEYYYEQRRLPLIEDHALISASEQAYFRRVALIARRKELEGMMESERPYVRGNLVEKADGVVIKVYFEADPEGHWLVAIHPFKDSTRNIDASNRFRYTQDGVYFPPVNPEYLVGYDSIRYDRNVTSGGHLSRASIKVWKVWDYFNAPDSRHFIQEAPAALYVHRPDTAEEGHKEFIKAMKYWAAIGSAERQVESMAKEVDKAGMTPFLTRDENGIPGIWTTTAVINDGVSSVVSRFAAPKEPGQKDQIATCPFIDELIDLENFDRASTTKYDIFMSDIFVERGLPHVPYTNQRELHTARMHEFLDEWNPSLSNSWGR